MKILYPGSFNPWHIGHQYVYDFACRMAGRENVFVGIAKNPGKNPVDPLFIKWTLAPTNVRTVIVVGTAVDACKKHGIKYMIRGVRPSYDLPQEASLDWWNHKLSGGDIETFFVFTPDGSDHISSSAVRVAIDLGRDEVIADLVNPHVLARWRRKTVPGKSIFFGRSCVGKTTHFAQSKIEAVDCDKAVWKYFGTTEKHEIKLAMKAAIEGRNREHLDVLIRDLAKRIDWRDFLHPGFNYDAAVLGVYFDFIPADVLAQFKLVHMQRADDSQRTAFAASRGMTVDMLKNLDWAYKDPTFWDEEINL